MLPLSFEDEQELQRVLAENPRLLVAAIERVLRTFAGNDSGGSVPAARPASPTGMRLVGSAASHRKPAVPPWRGSVQYQFVKRAGVWIETCREDPFTAHPLIADRATETPADPGRVQWDG
jgi:hypothetical protein